MGQLEIFTWMNYRPLPFFKIIISPNLFKKVEEDMGSSPLRRKVAQMIQSLSSMLITVLFILKSMHVALLIYLLLKELFITIVTIYYMFCQSNTLMYT